MKLNKCNQLEMNSLREEKDDMNKSLKCEPGLNHTEPEVSNLEIIGKEEGG